MSQDELKIVAKGCLNYLSDALERERLNQVDPTGQRSESEDRMFAHNLITAVLALGLAPRSQILGILQIGSSLAKEADGLYWIRALAEQSKNGRPTRFCLPVLLTPIFDAYLAWIRPRLLVAGAQSSRGAHKDAPLHDYVFFKRDGSAPRADFSSSTNVVTLKLLGRPINAHAFRQAVITTFYSDCHASQADMNILANLMVHDQNTAREFYFRPMHSQAAAATSQRMVDHLLR